VAAFLDQPIFGAITLNGPDVFMHGVTALLADTAIRIDDRRSDQVLLAEEMDGLRQQVAAGS
jgi:hypothetical protein